MDVVAQKAVTMRGMTYRPGEAVDTHDLDRSKVQQLLAQRALMDPARSQPGQCVALRTVRVDGRLYHRGDLVGTSACRPEKVAQLLEHRILDLAPVTTETKPSVKTAARVRA